MGSSEVAGWHVTKLPASKVHTVDDVLEKLREAYYAPRGWLDRIDDHLFVATPSAGASLHALGGG